MVEAIPMCPSSLTCHGGGARGDGFCFNSLPSGTMGEMKLLMWCVLCYLLSL